MRIIIPGGTGQVGTVLARYFCRAGHEVVILSRRPVRRGGPRHERRTVPLAALGTVRRRAIGPRNSTARTRSSILAGPQRQLSLSRSPPPRNHGFARVNSVRAGRAAGDRDLPAFAPRVAANEHGHDLRPSL